MLRAAFSALAPAKKVATPAVFAGGQAHGLNRGLNLIANLPGQLQLLGIVGPGKGLHVFKGFFPIETLLAMADQTIDGLGLIPPAGVAGEAPLIGHLVGGDTEIIE